MENRSRLPGEPSLDHPGVPTGRGGHRAGMKPLCGISSRLFWCLPALPRKCSDSRVGASSPGKCRSPQTAPRLWRPYLGSIEPSRFSEIMLDAFRASLTGPESCLLQLRPCMHKFHQKCLVTLLSSLHPLVCGKIFTGLSCASKVTSGGSMPVVSWLGSFRAGHRGRFRSLARGTHDL